MTPDDSENKAGGKTGRDLSLEFDLVVPQSPWCYEMLRMVEQPGPVETATPAPAFACRSGCGACCIAPSITTPLPGMPHGKPAGVPCVNLTDDLRCRIHGGPEYPAFCRGLRPSAEMCGAKREEALSFLTGLERETRPA